VHEPTSIRVRACGVAVFLVLAGLAASSEPGWAATVPVPPRSVRVAPGNARATVRWHKPANGGSPIRQYKVAAYHDNVSLGIYQFNSTATVDTVVGLKNGETLTFKVAAKNAAGWSKFSARSAPATIGAPVPVGTPSAVAGSARATVSWHAANGNGVSVNQYRVTPRINGHAKPAHVYGAAKTRQVIAGLTHGQKYTFDVTAHNKRGWGAPSNVSAEIKIK
jgi:hypothetical protein